MTQTDFAIAFGILIVIVFFVMSYTTNNFTNELDILKTSELRQASYGLGKQLLGTTGYPPNWYKTTPIILGLEGTVNKIQTIYEEVGDYEHKEKVKVSIFYTEIEGDPHVYDLFMNEVPSEIEYVGNKVMITFELEFIPLEKKRINIFYFGDSTNIEYSSNPTETNITGRILSEQPMSVIQQEKCYSLGNIGYENIRDLVGFEHQFRIDLTDCSYGLNAPDADVVVTTFPVLIERSDGLISAEIARVSVW